jgi:hypothetical protein
MSYSDLVDTRGNSVPYELFKFQWGPNADDVYAYTDSERPVQIGDLRYEPIPISRGKIRNSASFTGDLQIRLPVSSDLAKMYKGIPPTLATRVIIYGGQVNDLSKEVRTLWLGSIVSHTFQGGEIIVKCELDAAGLKRVGLRAHFQHGCPHALYGPSCRANKANATRATTVTGISSATLTLPAGWASGTDEAKFANGYVYYDRANGQPERVPILSATDSETLILGNRPPELYAGMSISVVLGCDHSMTDCTGLHSNIQNFGGCPWIPTDNPVGIKNKFY